MNNENDSEERLRDIERLTESLARANRELLTAQVIMHDRQNQFDTNLNRLTNTVDVLALKVDALAVKVDALTDSQKAQDDRVDKLVSAIGELIQPLPMQQ